MATDDPLQAYVERLLELRDEEGAAPRPEVLRRVARDLGLTDADLARAEALAEEHWTRGRGFLAHGLHDDAIRELREALVLRPGHLETTIGLAQAHVARWRRTGDGASRREAERLARAALAIEPGHGPAFAVLRELEQLDLAPRRRLVLGLAMAAMLIALGGGFFLWLGWSSDAPATEELPPGTDPSESRAPAVDPISPRAQAAAPDLQTLEVDFQGPAGFRWKTGFARLRNYHTSSHFELAGLLRNDTDRVLTRLNVRVVMLDARGRALAEDDRIVLGSPSPLVRPGDTLPVKITVKTDARATRARLVIETVKDEPAPRTWPASSPVALAWNVRQPPGIALEVRQREARSAKSSIGPGYFHTVVLEVTNKSPTAIRVLELEVRRLAADGMSVAEEKVSVAGSMWDPPLFAGETRLVTDSDTTPEPVDAYRLAVSKIVVE